MNTQFNVFDIVKVNGFGNLKFRVVEVKFVIPGQERYTVSLLGTTYETNDGCDYWIQMVSPKAMTKAKASKNSEVFVYNKE